MTTIGNILTTVLLILSINSVSHANSIPTKLANTLAQFGIANSRINQFKIDSEPDYPEGFGRKAVWFAIKSSHPEKVASTLNLSGGMPANWATGLQIAYGDDVPSKYDGYIFVSPSIDGWIFILSSYFYSFDYQINSDPDPKATVGFDLIFKTLYSTFPDVQLFGSHRGVAAILWVRALDGEIVRKYSIADGNVFGNYGALTKAEHALNLLDIGGLSPDETADAIFDQFEQRDTLESELIAAGKSREEIELHLSQSFKVSPNGFDEDLHFYIAEAWSISPENLQEMEIEKGVGILGKLPTTMLASPE